MILRKIFFKIKRWWFYKTTGVNPEDVRNLARSTFILEHTVTPPDISFNEQLINEFCKND